MCTLPHRLLSMFGASACVAVCNYFIPSTLGVVFFSISMGFLMSLDLGQIGTLCRGPRASFGDRGFRRGGSPPPPPSSFGWNLGCRELLLYLSLLLVAMTEAGLLHHFLGSAQSQSWVMGPQAPVSYLLLVLFCLCWALREIQGAYVFGGVLLNPLYPKGMSSVQTFNQRNRGLYVAAAIRRVLLYLGELFIMCLSLMFSNLNISLRCENNSTMCKNVFLTCTYCVLLHSVSICNDCFPVYGQISAAAPQCFSQCGIHTCF